MARSAPPAIVSPRVRATETDDEDDRPVAAGAVPVRRRAAARLVPAQPHLGGAPEARPRTHRRQGRGSRPDPRADRRIGRAPERATAPDALRRTLRRPGDALSRSPPSP